MFIMESKCRGHSQWKSLKKSLAARRDVLIKQTSATAVRISWSMHEADKQITGRVGFGMGLLMFSFSDEFIK